MNTLLQKHDRLTYIGLSLLGFSSVAYAYFSQEFLGFEPCPLCIVGRLLILLVSALLLLYAWRPWKGLTYALGALLLLGAGISLYHAWIQIFPPPSSLCGPGLSFWLETLNPLEILHNLFSGHGECTDSSWRIFGIPGSLLPLMYYLTVMIGYIIRQSYRVRPIWIPPSER